MAAQQAPSAETHEAIAAADAAHGAAAGGHEAAGVFPPFDASTFASQLFWFVLSFGALYFILSRFVLPKVEAVLAYRAATLKADLDTAAAESAAAEAARAEAERAAQAARASARKLIEDQRAAAAAEMAQERAKIDEMLAAQSSAAEARIGEMRRAALANVDAIAADLAGDIVARLAPGVR